jgi:tetratricopeptide (TPR) repeat protein
MAAEPHGRDVEQIGEDFLIFVQEEALRLDPDDPEALAFLAGSYTRRGRYEEGLALDRRLASLRADDPVVHYNLACSLSLTCHEEEALEALRRAIELGYDDFAHLEKDADLENVREHPGFEEVRRRLQS